MNKKGFGSTRVWTIGLVIGIFVLLMASALYMPSGVKSEREFVEVPSYRVVNNTIGPGNTPPKVVFTGENYSLVASMDRKGSISGYLNLTTVDSRGTVGRSVVVTQSVYHGHFAIAAPSKGGSILVAWMSPNGSALNINGTYVTVDRDGNIQLSKEEVLLDGAAYENPGDTGFALAYGERNENFFMVWSNETLEKNLGRFISGSSPAQLSPIIQISQDDANEHTYNYVAYDPDDSEFMVVWRQREGSSNYYSIYGRLFDSDGNPVGNDIKVADGQNDQVDYLYPSTSYGNGSFMITYLEGDTGGLPPSEQRIFGIYYYLSSSSLDNGRIIGKFGDAPYTTGIAYDTANKYFVVAWSNENNDILSQAYDSNGNPKNTEVRTVSDSSDVESGADVAVGVDTYYFVWVDTDSSQTKGSLWGADELVPEMNAVLPVFLGILVGLAFMRKRKTQA